MSSLYLFTVSSHIVTKCFEIDNFESNLQELLFKGKTKYSGIMPAEWNSVYICPEGDSNLGSET